MRFGDVFIDGRSHPSAVPGGLWHPHRGGWHGAAWLLAQRGAAVAVNPMASRRAEAPPVVWLINVDHL